MTERGVIYSATGEQYVREANESAASLRRVMPKVSITLFTDDTDAASRDFDEVRKITEPYFAVRDKFHALFDSPYERTIFIDTDTYICRDIGCMFDVLDRAEFAATHAPRRHGRVVPDVPDSFPELNGGVLVFRNTEAVMKLFHAWEDHYVALFGVDDQPVRDQAPLRRALWESDISLYVLPPEFNYRTIMPGFVGGRAKVHILHGREEDMRAVAKLLNRERRARIFPPHPLRPAAEAAHGSSARSSSWLRRVLGGA